jgi:integrase
MVVMLANKIDGNEKITKLHDDGTYDQIQRFLAKRERRSKGTRVAYERDIRKFFKVCFNKDIEYLTKDDFNLNADILEDYQTHLLQTLSSKTVNRNISSLKELIKYLRGKNHIETNIDYLNLIKSEPEKDNRYGVLSVDEVLEMTDRIMKMKRARDKEIKKYLFLFSLDTCARLGECLSVEWDDFRERENDVIINITAKGNKEFRPVISKEFYNELLSIKGDSKRVFPVSKNAVSDLMIKLRKEMNISKKRNCTFHSIRKAGVSFNYRITNDILQAKKAANHSNINTTLIYLQEEDYGATGVVSRNKDVKEDLFETVSHEELINAIKELPKNQQLLLNIKINELSKDS